MAAPTIDRRLIDEAVEAVAKYGSVSAAARALDLPRGTLSSRYHAAKDEWRRVNMAPLSEDASRFREDWTAEDCIAELRRLVDEHPDAVLSRNFVRVNSAMSESTWNRYFGTFEEFKRSAGVKLSRQQHSLERKIAKHASVDHYRAMNVQRAAYEGAYDRESGRRFKVLLRASDLHDIECDEFFLSVLIDVAKRVQPDVICLNGDVFDLPEFGKYQVDPRVWDVVGRIKHVHERILSPLREACPAAQIDLVEGNHEFRLLRHLADATPAMRAILADLHGMTVGQLLGLDKYEVNYHAKGDLAAYRERDIRAEVAQSYKVYWNAVLAYHFPDGKKYRLPGFSGHHHAWGVEHLYSAERGAYQWVHGGCGHVRDASYTDGTRWQLEFGLCHVDTQTGAVAHECIPVGDFAVAGGKYYDRVKP